MIFGKYINRYYLKNAPVLLLGLLALLMVDYIQLLIPQFYRLVINGVNLGQVVVNGQTLPFTKEVLLQHICLPMIWIVVLMVIGRFLWRICFFGSAVRVAANLRERMFDHSRQLSQQYYQVNKVGNLMSLYTNDIDTIQECFGDGILMFFDALVLGLMALYKMWRMDYRLTLLALIPALIMFGIGTVMGTAMTKRWEERQQAFSDLSDFAQENFSGIAVIKAFVKELKELMAFRKLNKQNEEINVIYTKIATLLEVLVTLFVESVICVILGYGGYLVYQGRFNAGQLVEYIGYFEAIVWPIMAISMLIEKTSRGKASLNRITELLNAPIDVADRPGVQELQNPQPRGYSPEFIRTVLLQTLVTAQWFYMLNCRVSDGFSLTKGLLANKGIWIVSGVLLVLQLLIIYAPFMQMLFGTTGLPFRYWVITFIIGFAMFLIVELEKPLTRKWRSA